MAKRRTPAQIRATRKLVAMNKARARGNPKRRKPAMRRKTARPGLRRMTIGGKHKWVRVNPKRLRIAGSTGPGITAVLRRRIYAQVRAGTLTPAQAEKEFAYFRKTREDFDKRGGKFNPPRERRIKIPKGWVKAKAVRVVRRGGKRIVEVKR